jgi:hypothetical protein
MRSGVCQELNVEEHIENIDNNAIAIPSQPLVITLATDIWSSYRCCLVRFLQ